MTNTVSFNADGVVLDALGTGTPVSRFVFNIRPVADTLRHTASFILE